MLIKFLSNNAEQHVSGEVGRGFITAGLAIEVIKTPVVSEPIWSVVLDASKFAVIKMELGQTTAYYQGTPEAIHDRQNWRGEAYCSAFGRRVPDSIIDQYSKARKKPGAKAPLMPLKLTHRTDNVAMAQEAARRNTSAKLYRPHVPDHEVLADADKALAKIAQASQPAD